MTTETQTSQQQTSVQPPSAQQAVQIGESFIGDGVNAAHVNTVLGNRNGPAGTAWATALATPSAGHVPFVTVLRPSLPVKPLTLFVTKAAPANDRHGHLIWGAAQAGIAAGVADALASGTVTEAQADSHVVIAAVWVNPAADDEEAVYRNNRESARTALENGARQLPSTAAVIEARNSPSNPFFTPRG
ncbi:formaldehyde-activating enzyme [Pseudarthrobacter cellobiosi]|uniref:formaldehyde-activating enzyme n=1 Tax=Pseudarthrobacter cellobiosi TaxID=2953654 RepID=UPI00208E0675|nr:MULTISPECIES: formaldehyde-activating enzyme [unclassified Pseudarthrobacter]MCO4254239.1 formaldehyde-activating enzyme [Pseudarthrobacter sp. HLT1-5]MCO4275891.1 formaldehyde-activating enzyme [Pseudarthrobacter sp. HLT3-5]